MNIPVDVIHPASGVDLINYTYTQIYAISDVASIVVNGIAIGVPKSVLIPINVRSIASSALVFCLGTRKNTFTIPQQING